ncbi:unnamed protein product, partial [Mesorhabditis belari]|uniref:G-protein coupled receptors family 1 profile domain-containing protein n=1 Tax=Mesorhabditis belari TaxID=2138241 RepID=A0AAF3E9T1_9BILA
MMENEVKCSLIFEPVVMKLVAEGWNCSLWKQRMVAENFTQDELGVIGEYLCNHRNLTEDDDLYCAVDESSYSLAFQGIVWAAFILLILAAVVGNVCVMWIIYSHKVMHHGFNYFLFNMALADLLIAVFNVGSSWSFNLYYDWWYGNFCTVNQFFGVAPTCVSVFSMMALSWDRCQAVVNPLRKRPLSTKRTVITILFIWLISSLLALPITLSATVISVPVFYMKPRKMSFRRICHADYPVAPINILGASIENPYENALFIVQYAIPLCLLSFTFARIALAFRRSDNTVATQNSKRSDQIKAKSKAVKMLALMVATFMICWAPYHFYHTFLSLNIFSEDLRNFFHASYVGVYWLAMSSCAYNPIIYCYANARFRIGFRYAFRWLPFIDFRSEEYELSQLFPERLRSMAFSKMEKSSRSKNSNGMTEMNNRKRSRLCMRLLTHGGATTTTTYTNPSSPHLDRQLSSLLPYQDKPSPPDIVHSLLCDGEELEEDDSPNEDSLQKEHSRLLNEFNR